LSEGAEEIAYYATLYSSRGSRDCTDYRGRSERGHGVASWVCSSHCAPLVLGSDSDSERQKKLAGFLLCLQKNNVVVDFVKYPQSICWSPRYSFKTYLDLRF